MRHAAQKQLPQSAHATSQWQVSSAPAWCGSAFLGFMPFATWVHSRCNVSLVVHVCDNTWGTLGPVTRSSQGGRTPYITSMFDAQFEIREGEEFDLDIIMIVDWFCIFVNFWSAVILESHATLSCISTILYKKEGYIKEQYLFLSISTK